MDFVNSGMICTANAARTTKNRASAVKNAMERILVALPHMICQAMTRTGEVAEAEIVSIMAMVLA